MSQGSETENEGFVELNESPRSAVESGFEHDLYAVG